MFQAFKFQLFLLAFLASAQTRSYGESSTCLTVYKEGGAPAVFQSPKCPRWKLSNYGPDSRTTTTMARCQSAMLQGRRKSQEDRILCALDIRIPFPGTTMSTLSLWDFSSILINCIIRMILKFGETSIKLLNFLSLLQLLLKLKNS